MPTVTQNLAMIRRRLGNPLPSAPDDQVLLQMLIDQLMHHHAQTANTSNHWAIDSFTIAASSGTEDYVVTGANFGRPFLVHTEDTSDTYHVRREIPFTLLQNADRLYSGPQQSGYSDEHSAEEVIFYRRGAASPAWYARFVPIPNASGDYRVWFDTVYEYGSLSDAPGLQAFHHLLRVQTALSALPFTEWRGVTKADNPKGWTLQVSAIRDSLLHDEMKFQKEFNEYRSQSNREGVSSKLLYGWEREEGYYGSTGRLINGWGI